MQQNNQRAEWIVDKIFEDNRYMVEVKKLPVFHPRWSLSILAKTPKGVSRFVSARSSGQGDVSIDPIASPIYDLLLQAEEYIAQQMQVAEDDRIERLQSREYRDLDRSKPKRRHGLKSLARMDREKRLAGDK